jgi:DNA repair protein RecO (recombination protein O)
MDFADDALVLSVVAYSDDDLVVRLFTREHGRIGAFARAARRSKKRYPGGVHPFSLGRVTLKPRRGDALFVLVDGALTPILQATTVEPVVLGRASYLAELIEKLLPEADPAPDVFDDVARAMTALPFADARLLRAFELRLLDATGYLPDLSGANDDAGAPVVAWDAVAGHLLSMPSARTVPFTDEARHAAMALLSAPLTAPPDVDDDVLRVVSRIFASHLRRQQIGPLKSIAFLRAIRALESDGVRRAAVPPDDEVG